MKPDDYLAKAHRALASAHLLLSDGDWEGACNRAYYAVFDAAQAALLHQSRMNPAETHTHSGLIAAFGNHLVKSGTLAADLGRSLNHIERIRLLADYTGEGIESERASWVVDQAESFVQAILQYRTGAGTNVPDKGQRTP